MDMDLWYCKLLQNFQKHVHHIEFNEIFLYRRQRSKEEFYVCFQDGIPQNMIELTFKAGFGLKSC